MRFQGQLIMEALLELTSPPMAGVGEIQQNGGSTCKLYIICWCSWGWVKQKMSAKNNNMKLF